MLSEHANLVSSLLSTVAIHSNRLAHPISAPSTFFQPLIYADFNFLLPTNLPPNSLSSTFLAIFTSLLSSHNQTTLQAVNEQCKGQGAGRKCEFCQDKSRSKNRLESSRTPSYTPFFSPALHLSPSHLSSITLSLRLPSTQPTLSEPLQIHSHQFTLTPPSPASSTSLPSRNLLKTALVEFEQLQLSRKRVVTEFENFKEMKISISSTQFRMRTLQSSPHPLRLPSSTR